MAQQRKTDMKETMKTVGIGVAGAAVGAAVSAAAISLSDKENRKKVTASVVGLSKKAEKTAKALSDTSASLLEKGKVMAKNAMGEAKKESKSKKITRKSTGTKSKKVSTKKLEAKKTK